MELFVGGLWGSFLESWRLLGTLLGGLGGSLGTFLCIWAAPWVTFSGLGGSLGDLVAPSGTKWLPEPIFFYFGCVLGFMLGGFGHDFLIQGVPQSIILGAWGLIGPAWKVSVGPSALRGGFFAEIPPNFPHGPGTSLESV